MHRRIWRIRAFDERAVELRRAREIRGPVHPSIGQEAACVGACMALRDDDGITGNHRSHGHPIAKGARLGPLFAELLGRARVHRTGRLVVADPAHRTCGAAALRRALGERSARPLPGTAGAA